MALKRKRAPGGGRKPKGAISGKSEVFTTRITPETRRALEREAEAAGQSVSQVAERFLRLGLYERGHDRIRNKPLKAFSFLIEQLAMRIGGGRWLDSTRLADTPEHLASVLESMDEWRTNPFKYRAFKIALNSLVGALEPRGEIKPPYPDELLERTGSDNPVLVEMMKKVFSSPENLAEHEFTQLWTQLNRAHPLTDNEREMLRRGDWVGERIVQETYALSEARHELGLSQGERE